ncbi:NADH:flavin oxidoreductase [Dehalobacterium formicoaceticum]|uniref:NADH:flavin oxidoreductase n=1 Tax=Dehalobacterium formicoaceticum TaxID=51515 RepID=A0ABT1Y691_9FIRM|nr:NADH:flavin oxidoreductase [Dehalobacterium formicoaceticum]MCR6546403.1 NADH:flavin oxidoreductase [Dehalobacterium formicoaceticum]
MNLFDKTQIGSLDVKNHFLRSATYEGKATKEGFPTEATKSIYRNLALCGVGTIITSYTYITEYEQPDKHQLGIYNDSFVEAYRDLTDTVHTYDTQIVMQIVHGSSLSQGYPERAKILGPSAIVHPASGITPQEMTKDEIQDVVRSFADAAGRVKAAGFDGVQLHCAHGYLLAQFISPLFNQRTDEYGGSVQNRLRILLEVYEAVRKNVGKDYPVWVKMNSSDEVPNGLEIEDFLKISVQLAQAGIDAIEVSGDQWSKHKANERLYYKEAAIKLSEAVDIPVILTGGIRTIADMKQVYQNSKVNLFGFARPFLKNPAFIQSLS